MAKKLPPLEEWTRPWKDGELDEDKAAGLIYNLTRDNLRLKDVNASLNTEKEELSSKLAERDDEVADLKQAGKTVSTEAKDEEIRTLRNTVRALERDKGKRTPEDQAYIDRLEVANDHKLSVQDAKRLVGSTREELEEDAKELAKRFGLVTDESGAGEGENEGHQGPPTRQPLAPVQYRTGGEPPAAGSKSVNQVLDSLPPLD